MKAVRESDMLLCCSRMLQNTCCHHIATPPHGDTATTTCTQVYEASADVCCAAGVWAEALKVRVNFEGRVVTGY